MSIISKIPLLRSLVRQYGLVSFQKAWRRRNIHNSTVAMNVFPKDVVTVGEATYGELHVLSYCRENECIEIGSYVSIAPNVQFIPGGNHQVYTPFTYPLYSRVTGQHNPKDSDSRGKIVVEDEVWIGYGVTILSGVTIGKGSIIGAGAVVTKDVPPFAVVAGNPAKVIKYRFDDNTRETLSRLSLKDIAKDKIRVNISLLYDEIKNEEQAKKLIATLTNGQ